MEKRERPESLKKDLEDQKEQNSKSFLDVLKPAKSTSFKAYNPENEKALPRQFFRQEVVELAKALLGKVFVRTTEDGVIKAVIVETQAYKAPLDKGCHAYNNKKTEKTKYFWLDGGHLYIYNIYGAKNICLNVVAGLQDQPEAVLIRGVQPIEGLDLVKNNRSLKTGKVQDLSNGPGKVGQALGINKQKMNGMDLLEGQFKVVDAGFMNFNMGVSRRVNIDYAEEWIDKPWRFYVEGNSYVSKVSFKDPVKKKESKKKPKKEEQDD